MAKLLKMVLKRRIRYYKQTKEQSLMIPQSRAFVQQFDN